MASKQNLEGYLKEKDILGSMERIIAASEYKKKGNGGRQKTFYKFNESLIESVESDTSFSAERNKIINQVLNCEKRLFQIPQYFNYRDASASQKNRIKDILSNRKKLLNKLYATSLEQRERACDDLLYL